MINFSVSICWKGKCKLYYRSNNIGYERLDYLTVVKTEVVLSEEQLIFLLICRKTSD